MLPRSAILSRSYCLQRRCNVFSPANNVTTVALLNMITLVPYHNQPAVTRRDDRAAIAMMS